MGSGRGLSLIDELLNGVIQVSMVYRHRPAEKSIGAAVSDGLEIRGSSERPKACRPWMHRGLPATISKQGRRAEASKEEM